MFNYFNRKETHLKSMFYQTNVMILVWTVYLCVFAHVQAISVEPRFCPSDEVQEEVFGKVITTPAPDVLEKVAEDEVNKKRLDVRNLLIVKKKILCIN